MCCFRLLGRIGKVDVLAMHLPSPTTEQFTAVQMEWSVVPCLLVQPSVQGLSLATSSVLGML